MTVKKLTKKQLKNMHSFRNNATQALRNGEIGYCKAVHILVVCCSNCGDYMQIHVKLDELQYKT